MTVNVVIFAAKLNANRLERPDNRKAAKASITCLDVVPLR